MNRKCFNCESDNLEMVDSNRKWFGHNYAHLKCGECGNICEWVFTDEELQWDDYSDPIKTELIKSQGKILPHY